MSDFARALRDAAAATAADTVAPPFARIERARQRRRATRAAVAGVAAVAALGGIAIAVPGGGSGTVTPGGSPEPSVLLKPVYELSGDTATRELVRRCVDAENGPSPRPTDLWQVDQTWGIPAPDPAAMRFAAVYDRCLERHGYAPFATKYLEESDTTSRVARECTDERRTTVVGTGVVDGKEWGVRAYAAERRICLRVTWGGKRFAEYVSHVDLQRRGDFHREPFVPGARDMLVWGWVQPQVTRVEIRVDGTVTSYDTIRLDGIDRPLYAMHVRFPPGGEKRMTWVEFDAKGNEVWPPSWGIGTGHR